MECPAALLKAPQRTPTKELQQDFGHILSNDLAHNRTNTTLNQVLVDASLLEEPNKLKKSWKQNKENQAFSKPQRIYGRKM